MHDNIHAFHGIRYLSQFNVGVQCTLIMMLKTWLNDRRYPTLHEWLTSAFNHLPTTLSCLWDYHINMTCVH